MPLPEKPRSLDRGVVTEKRLLHDLLATPDKPAAATLRPLPIRPFRVRHAGEVLFSPARALYVLLMLVAGYEILRYTKGAKLPAGFDAILGRPGPPYSRGALLTRETFNYWRERRYISKVAPYVTRGWQVWRITEAGRAAARRRRPR